MLKRKVEQIFTAWKNNPSHSPLVVKGPRQCGKTFSVVDFAQKNYKNVHYLNFYEHKELSSVFSGSLTVDTIIMNLSALFGPTAKFEPHDTCLIFDELQECPEARTSLKFFKIDGRYDVICTGSLLGIRGYGIMPKSVPVGYEETITMNPLDFEEFLWANGINESVFNLLSECFEQEKPVPEAIHNRMIELLMQYTIVGGMPEVVNIFIESKQIGLVVNKQRQILDGYRDDMIKYASAADKPLICDCFDSIPMQLSRENKKFQYSVVKKGSTAARFAGSLRWCEDAGIIRRCNNLEITELPLDGNAMKDVFKIYMADTGLFVAMLEDGTQHDILNGNLYGYKGAIFENLIADIFGKMGRKLYYFHKESGLEIDFVIRYKGECVPIEVKASTGNTKSTKTLLAHPEKYHVSRAIKFGNYNVGMSGAILTLPTYMAFMLQRDMI